MQALVWLCVVWFQVVRRGAARVSASSYVNLRQPQILKHQI